MPKPPRRRRRTARSSRLAGRSVAPRNRRAGSTACRPTARGSSVRRLGDRHAAAFGQQQRDETEISDDTPALNAPHMMPAAMTGASIRCRRQARNASAIGRPSCAPDLARAARDSTASPTASTAGKTRPAEQHDRPPAERLRDAGLREQPEAMPNGQVERMTAIASTISRRANQSAVILVMTRLNRIAPMPLISRPRENRAITVRQRDRSARRRPSPREPSRAKSLVADALDDQPARQRQEHAGDVVQADQRANFGEADVQFADQPRRDGADRLVLETPWPIARRTAHPE